MSERYEPSSKTLWVASKADGDTLVSNDLIKTWTAALASGKLADGRAVSTINVVFQDPGGADYNSTALSFAKVGTFIGSVENPKKHAGEDPTFDTKDDFGIG